jgi:hypothetical protein
LSPVKVAKRARALSVMVAVVMAVALFGIAPVTGCAEAEAEPVAVARDYARAVRRRNVKMLLEVLEAPALAHLDEAAERASDQVGGRRNVEPHEMLQVVRSDPFFEVASSELLENDGEHARVKLSGTEGESHIVELVREETAWKVRIPLPPVRARP